MRKSQDFFATNQNKIVLNSISVKAKCLCAFVKERGSESTYSLDYNHITP